MESYGKIVTAVSFVGVIILAIGIGLFSFGFVSDYSNVTGVGIGTVMGAVFIFLMGMFFAATGEMLEKRYTGIKVDTIKVKRGARL
ncbi:hypothetical protein [Peribacillus sp. SCS-155]|uniref:hypothetical protein n=1 Tax=Peribacillus sedimenti TaxID=3115297 RepID=UPI0039059230